MSDSQSPKETWENTSSALTDFRKSVAEEQKPSSFKVEVGELKSPIEMAPAKEVFKNAGEIALKAATKTVDYLVSETAASDFRVAIGAVNAATFWLVAADPLQRIQQAESITGAFFASGLTALTTFFATESVRLRFTKSANT